MSSSFHWLVYAGVVIFGAAGIHIFSRMTNALVHPVYALVIGSAVAFVLSCLILLFTPEVKAQIFAVDMRGVILAVVVGVCWTVANYGVFAMYNAGAPLSLSVPLVRMGAAALAIVVGLLFFSETLTMMQILGLVLSVVSMIMIVR